MKIYLVGGAVRDKLLGWPVKEQDWVVVGATVQEMLSQGYRQVGKEFPVFLHPKTNEEYALARMERKTGPGYKGFAFDSSPQVTLKDDLSRRDLTINAMAQTADGTLVDPFNGQADLKAKLLRHVSTAFAEDPVRILRIGRFYARYAHLGFKIAPDTLALMRQMVQAGEVDALVPERVWKELERALGERNPEKFFEALDACDALSILFPTINMAGTGMRALVTATQSSKEAILRFAVLLHDLPEPKQAIAELCNRYRLPIAYRELATLVALNYQTALASKKMDGPQLLQLFGRLDIYRRESRFQDFITACKAIASTHNQTFDSDWLQQAGFVVKSVEIKPLVEQGLQGQALADAIRNSRLEKLGTWLKKNLKDGSCGLTAG